MGKRFALSLAVVTLLAGGMTTLAQKPANAPAKATAQCTDGTFSTAKTERGACSKHGGVKTWFGSSAASDTKSSAAAGSKSATRRETNNTAAKAGAAGNAARKPPAGATGQCGDGTYTRAKSEKGACSKHGGVTTWFATDTPAAGANAPAPTPVPRTQAPTPTQPAPSAPTRTEPAQRPAPTGGSTPKSSGSGKAPTVAPPAGTPDNATAKCKDGTYSFAKGHSGACSRHGGVAEWYK